MQIVHHIAEVKRAVAEARQRGQQIGLVPTMGALHEGHASLISRSMNECGLTVVSIFVNPTQFNDPSDLKSYPRTLEADCRIISEIELNATAEGEPHRVVAFAPSVEEMYPEPDTRTFSYPPIDAVMEGARRPGHFNGVCQVVSKLFSIAEPDRAYFGEKDFQQIAVVRAMMADQGFDFELVSCPIVREESGLALSSRNKLLSDDERVTATAISRVLRESTDYSRSHSVSETRSHVIDSLNAVDGLEVEYFSIVDAKTLQDISEWSDADAVQGCITVYCGARPVRLIDNVRYR